MVLRRGNGVGQCAQTEVFQAREKTFVLLTAKHPEHEFRGVSRAAPRHHGQNETGEIGVVEIGDAAPSRPPCFARVNIRACAHILSGPCCSREHTSGAMAPKRKLTAENACSASVPAPGSWSRCAGRTWRRAVTAFFRRPAGRRSGHARG